MSDVKHEQRGGRARGLFWVGLSYVVALAAAWFAADWAAGRWADSPFVLLWAFGAADLAATLVVYVFSMIFDNSSFYDPYWSVKPMVVAVWLAVVAVEIDLRTAIAFALVLIYGARLTGNWIRRWTGLGDEDFRYADFREKGMVMYRFVSLTGFHFFPTVLVWLGCLPLFVIIEPGTAPFGIIDVVAILVTGGAILIEAIADQQLAAYLRAKRMPGKVVGETLDSGLWAWSRHPNYFGEMSFWWGLWLFAMAAGTSNWWTGVGALSISLLFIFISVPMMDKRMVGRRPSYGQHMKRVSALFPMPPKRA